MAATTPRLEWISKKIEECFSLEKDDVTKCLTANLSKIDDFFNNMEAPPKLFFFFQPRQFKKPELYLSLVGDGEKLAGKCIYFLRQSNKPIKTNLASDNTVISGEVNQDLLLSFQKQVSELYKPVLNRADRWGAIAKEDDASGVFLRKVDKFDEELQNKIKNLRGDVEIAVPSAPYDKIEQKPAAYARAAKDPDNLKHFTQILAQWCKTIKKYIEDDTSNTPLATTSNDGPRVEIEYWSRRMLTLISITEQLKSKSSRVVTGVLKARALRNDEESSPEAVQEREDTKNQIEEWREVDLAITDRLNEAKDNVRFLNNIKNLVEGLENDNPRVIAESMKKIMNSMKMIHTLSRHYGTKTRMTNLFARITNQLIQRCRSEIYQNQGVQALWNRDASEAMQVMQESIALFKAYLSSYKETKSKLLEMSKGKQFDFDETEIFGKFDKFCRRLEKVLSLFESIEQFKLLEAKRIDGMNKLIDRFDTLIMDFKSKGHDLLDYDSSPFERDYIAFVMNNSSLENSIQKFMEETLSRMSNIEKQLELLQKFGDVVKKECLEEHVKTMYNTTFKLYGADLLRINELYNKQYMDPPIPRNMTRIAGNIQWSRQLVRRITKPMKIFQQHANVFHSRESKKVVKNYNKLAQTLISFEDSWFNGFKKACSAARKGLNAALVVEDEDDNLFVNFDANVLKIVREAKTLNHMGFVIPPGGSLLLMFEKKTVKVYEQLKHLLKQHKTMHEQITPVTRSLLKPHLKALAQIIKPALTHMTWTSMNVDKFMKGLEDALHKFQNLVDQTNDITNNRIDANLKFVSSLVLLNAPEGTCFTVKDFKERQHKQIELCTQVLLDKNLEIERAVGDLIKVCVDFDHASTGKTEQLDINFVKLHYCHLLFYALMSATKQSLDLLRQRVGKSSGLFGKNDPLFEVELSLHVPDVVMTPTMTDVQEAVQSVAREILQATKNLLDWGIDNTGRPRSSVSFYNKLSADKNLAIVCLLLNGALNETKKISQSALSQYDHYSWLWVKEPDEAYNTFVAEKNPILEDFLVELNRFGNLNEDISGMPDRTPVGSLSFNVEKLKLQFKNECMRWTHQYSAKLHGEVKEDMEQTTVLMADLQAKLERDTKDFSSVKFVMDAMKEIREVQSWINAKFASIIQRYNMLEDFLAPGAMTKEEMDAKSVLTKQWAAIEVRSAAVMVEVNAVAPNYKQGLIQSVKEYQVLVEDYKSDYDLQGPNEKGIVPLEAMTRLSKYRRDFESLQRKYELYNGGEKLFGLPQVDYPDLVIVEKELKLLDRLYSLYSEVITTIDRYKEISWTDVVQNIQSMNDTVEGFSAQVKKLPKKLRTDFDAYFELKDTVENFILILPLLLELSKSSMRGRHWEQISALTGQSFDILDFNNLKLGVVLGAGLLEFKEDIEEITDGADKQLAIEHKLDEIKVIWDVCNFEFGTWKERGEVILAGGIVGETIEKLEESQSSLVQMLTQKHVLPFKEQAAGWLKKLSDVNDTLEGWIKVQMLWMSLEAVFTGGDIARQMPQDTRVFMKVDKEWCTRLMSKAKELTNVVECCQNEYIKNMLPAMYEDLEKCQKALDGYLEAKRSKFPRFYFVSNPALLLILSQGSDKEAVQDAFPKIFDAIDRVEFNGLNIVTILGQKGGYGGKMDQETIELVKPVAAKGNIEAWLATLLTQMASTIHSVVESAAMDFETMPLTDLIAKYCGQVSLMAIQMLWTQEVQSAITRSKTDKTAISSAAKNQMRVLSELSQLTTTEIPTKMERTKVETLVTIQVHQVDVVDELAKLYKEKKLKDASDFEWQKQLRLYWVPEKKEAVIKVADVDFAYCNEYLGCKERLVITPLTDRCYISLTQAIGMNFGGAPAGPAGTGKTETTKDLGRALGKLVVVFNCSDQMHTADTAKIYKGLCQSGSWGCFDEFNRIDLEVLSVVAQQVEAILKCLRAREKQFSFPGDDIGPIEVDDRCGFFITMNPGYAGRQELPENLKALFRGVAMMVPDREIIMKVKLASVGYTEYNMLSKKFCILYQLSEEQLSKQRHYDFGLRNILSVLRTGGVNLRIELKKDSSGDRQDLEEMLMMRTLRDMNLAKLVADDVGLFISLLHDLFPAQADPEKKVYEAEEEAMKKLIKDFKLIQHDDWMAKIIQLYETSLVRHGLMMVGPAGGGKTEGTKVLVEALSVVHGKASIVKMYPKAITAEEMFGQNDLISGEWTHGIFSSIWGKFNDPKKHTTWIVCDGPVDAIWIENLNTVLDDNKLLTLANGDRIPMTDNVRILFEVQDLRNASPATVSRAGIVYVSDTDLGHEPVVEAWMLSRREEEGAIIREIYDKYCEQPDILDWLSKNTENCMKAMPVHLMQNLFALLGGLLKPSVDEQKVLEQAAIERFFLYCLAWSLGSLLEESDRFKFSSYLTDLADGQMPPCDEESCLYEYYVNDKTYEWELWTPPEYIYNPDRFEFATALIPTVDSVRAEFLLRTLNETCNKPVLIVGSSGTAKTSIVLQYTNDFDQTKRLLKKVNFSSATTAGMFQNSMMSDIEKRQGKTFAPSGGRTMTVFLDDVSMPEVNTWGDQPTLEIVRQIIEEGGFMFLEKDKRGIKMDIENVMYIGVMNHPGGGRNDIPNRLKRHFFTLNCTPPSKASIDNIYGTMLRGHFEGYTEQVALIDGLTKGTIDLWTQVKGKMLPTPSKFHYIFNMRDLSRIFQGVLFAPHECVEEENNLLRLWKHECERVLCDKLVNDVDKAWYQQCSMKILGKYFTDEEAIRIKGEEEKDPTYFVDFLRNDVIDEETDEVLELAPKIYEVVQDVQAFKDRIHDCLEVHNTTHGNKVMNLVLFKDALEHMLRISRIIGMPRGNALLVGVGGSGRQSLTRLAAFIARHEIFQIKLTRSYKIVDFLDDIRHMYTLVGKEGKKLTWIFTDFEILKEDFLEYINAILATGEVAGLFPKDERDMMCADLREPAKRENPSFDDTPDNLYKYFLNRIRSNLHIVLVFSPANEKFAERARKFPGLIQCNIDWFLRWPEQALIDVSNQFIKDDANFNLEATESVKEALVNHIAAVHNLVTYGCDEYFQKFRRAVFVTPKSYLSFITGYKMVYNQKLKEISVQENNVKLGLKKLAEAEVDVANMQGVLEGQKIDLQKAEKEANAMLKEVEAGSKIAMKEKASAEVIETKCVATAEQINQEKAAANKELEGALPFVKAAVAAASKITKDDIGLITKLGSPPDLIKRIMECVLLLFNERLVPVAPGKIKISKDEYMDFIGDSYATYSKSVMGRSDFLPNVIGFGNVPDEKLMKPIWARGEAKILSRKDMINGETIELLEPYLTCPDFNAQRAQSVANAAEGLCTWVIAMNSYHHAAKICAPLLNQLQIKEGLYDVAMKKLAAAQASSNEAQAKVDELTRVFNETMAKKTALKQKADETAQKMDAANTLISSLGGEKVRWKADESAFGENKKRLVGNVALSCAFVSYLGPFNQAYRTTLLNEKFYPDAMSKNIPITKDLSVTGFLVDDAIIAEWNSQGLPKDDLSVQNGILVTQASRYPLLVDPQGQALQWLKKRENEHFPIWGTTFLNAPKIRDELEFCMEEGKPLLVEGVVKDIDPMFDPVLEKNLVKKGRSNYILLGDKMVGLDKNFRLYFLTKLGNPTFSPELSAKTTIIDFSVTQRGLEDQLLSRVIQAEQKSLEDQRQQLVEEVNKNTIALQQLDEELLDRLSNSKGNLLEDIVLIQVLQNTKEKAKDVGEKIEASKETEEIINKKREQYRPVACRASVIYFVIVQLPAINVMYQIALSQFLEWFDFAIENSDKANLVAKRVEILIDYLTFHIYKNVSRGLFEADKLIYKLMFTMQVTITEQPDNFDQSMVDMLLRGGAALTQDQIPRKPLDWLSANSWANMVQLSMSIKFFADIKNSLDTDRVEWQKWYEAEAPEEIELPKMEDRLSAHPSGAYYRFLTVRCMRDDRARLAANTYIARQMGKKYTEPETVLLMDIYNDSGPGVPTILLLTPGADPTTALHEAAKRNQVKIKSVSMGEGQEKYAHQAIDEGMESGDWALLQNCHLGLGFMNQLDEKIKKAMIDKGSDMKPTYRTWITCEPHKDFPINLLQMSIKVTNEPPAGMRAGLDRSYRSAVDDERLQRVETADWRKMVYTICFLHSTVQERRKFGAVGWCIPYEFNGGDLDASLTFMEKHFFAAGSGLSWATIQYMISEVQYGGRITDDFDRILFNTFGYTWLTEKSLEEGFKFCNSNYVYDIPDSETTEGVLKHVGQFPAHDTPEIFGLHTNADLTFGTSETIRILQTISETQPKNSSKAGGKTREEIVYEKADELLKVTPEGYKDQFVRDAIRKRKKSEMENVLGHSVDTKVDGFSIPLNVFLYQEITRLNSRISAVRATFTEVMQAINGEIIMTPELQDALNAIFEAKPPKAWYIDPSGAEIAWSAPSLASWFTGLLERQTQLKTWLDDTRPMTYWLTGFFNPQGFLTAARQEITRRHKAEKWALDDVSVCTQITDIMNHQKIKDAEKIEGFYIHGLYLEGASWDRSIKGGQVKESQPKELFTAMPIIKVYAIQNQAFKNLYGKGHFYDCPCYTKPRRTDLAYVFVVKLPSSIDPDHWTLRGVALLCSTE